MTPDDRQRLEAVATYCERMGVDDLRTVPVDDPWALAAAIRAALAEPQRAVARVHRWYREGRESAHAGHAMPEHLPNEGTTAERWRLRGFFDEQRRYRIADLEREHVSREDREAAMALAHECGYHYGREQFGGHDEAMAEACRLLKLEDA